MTAWPTLLGVLAALAGLGLAGTSGLLISRSALRPEDFLSLTLLVTAVRALGLGRAGLRYAERLAGHAAALQSGERARLRLFDTLARFGRDLHAHERSGDLLSRGGADIDAAQFRTLRVVLPLWAAGGVVSALGIWLWTIDPALALLATLPVLAASGGVWARRGPVERLAAEDMALGREHGTRLLDALAASGEGAGRHHAPALATLESRLEQVARAQGRLSGQLTLGRDLAFALCAGGVLWRGAALVEAGALPGAVLAAVTLASVTAVDVLVPLSALPAAQALARVAAQRQAALEALQPAVQAPAAPWPLPGGPFEMELRRVSLRRAGRVILEDVSLRLAAGERVALSGASGAGKTTLLALLCRDLDPDGGQVTFGGRDLRGLDPAALRRRLSLHEQGAPLLDGTLSENLRLGDHGAPDETLRALLDDLGLTDLPLDLWVGEGGSRLSGGQRARVSLARALLKPSEALLLDEPTAFLDDEAEARALQVIERERRGRALLIVTHRAAPLAMADVQYVLHEGILSPAGPAPERSAV
ncbi:MULTISPECIES: amino acid ABC transporter ATP-binding/permease protein [Deinococcus]|uniref:Amino acid ABC transporter ATP-binding/permease protein n=1 Tax=Deinococcus rufus TaxID=2136097 RepID=A0ABV7Z7C9_9DEIO|nr:ATP-binding cassette domain-containing protein [Deinococcus sp. AB2017081]WQE97222.1 ATP-binding cassette domain-containing protein [Deinococcus sp. AB2017081]